MARASNGLAHLVVARAEAPSHVLVIKHLHFEAEVLLQVLDQHHKKRQLDAERLGGISRAGDVGRADIGAHDLQD